MAEDPNKVLEEANNAFVQGDYQRAFDMWTSLLSGIDEEHHYALHTNRGAALERLGRVEDAILAYDAALASNPRHVEALHNRGVALKAAKRYAEALSSFETALGVTPDFYPSLRGKADILSTLERYDEAVTACTAAIGAAGSDFGPWADRAFCHLRLKKLQEAIADYEEARRLGDTSADTSRLYAIALSQRAVELDKASDFSAAEDHYSKAIAIEATESRLFNRSFLFMRVGRTEEAVAGFREVCKLSDANYQARAALGTLLLQMENFEDAAAALAEAVNLKPDQTDVIYNLAFAYLKLNRPEEAETHFKMALGLDPSMEQAKAGLAAAEVLRAQLAGGNIDKPKMKLIIGGTIDSGAAGEEGEGSSGGAAAAPASRPPPGGGAAPPPPPPPPPAPAAAPPAPISYAPTLQHAASTAGTSPKASPAAGLGVPSGAVAAARAAFVTGGSGPSTGPGSRIASASPAAGAAPVKKAGGVAAGAMLGSGVPLPVQVVRDPIAEAQAAAAAASSTRPASPSAMYAQSPEGFDGVIHPYSSLKAPGPYPEGIDLTHREAYLSADEFKAVFNCTKPDFYAFPKWKRVQLRKSVGLF